MIEIVSNHGGMTFNLVGRKASKMSDTDSENHKMLVHLTLTDFLKMRALQSYTEYFKIRKSD